MEISTPVISPTSMLATTLYFRSDTIRSLRNSHRFAELCRNHTNARAAGDNIEFLDIFAADSDCSMRVIAKDKWYLETAKQIVEEVEAELQGMLAIRNAIALFKEAE